MGDKFTFIKVFSLTFIFLKIFEVIKKPTRISTKGEMRNPLKPPKIFPPINIKRVPTASLAKEDKIPVKDSKPNFCKLCNKETIKGENKDRLIIPPQVMIYRGNVLKNFAKEEENIKDSIKIIKPKMNNLIISFLNTKFNIEDSFLVIYSVKNRVSVGAKGENAIETNIIKEIKALKVP
jgi:hypothetical protein